MKLWIDGQAFQSGSAYRGIGRYVSELLIAIIQQHPNIDIHISFNAAMPDALMEARSLVQKWIKPDNIHLWHGAAKAGEITEGFSAERQFSEIMLAHHVSEIAPDIAFSVSPFEGSNDLCVPLINKYGHDYLIASIFYDAIPIRFPERYLPNSGSMEYYDRRLHAYFNFDLCLSISNFADQELKDIADVKHSIPIFAGLSKAFGDVLKSKKLPAKKERIIDEPYMLYVGGLDWRKNVDLIIEAYSMSEKTKKSGLNFVIAGDTYEREETAFRQKWTTANLSEDKLKIIGRVSDEKLIDLYSCAEFSVLPSFMEGFGLTVVESIACGTPVLASNAGALSEVLGDSAGLFTPTNGAELSSLFEQMLNSKFREKLLRDAAKRIQRYTWENTANLTIEAFKTLISDHKMSDAPKEKRKSITALAVRKLDLPASFMAEGLSLATPIVQQAGRMFLDATSTTICDHGTGIQRVVKSIAKNILEDENYKSKTQLIFCDNKGPFSPLKMHPNGQFETEKGENEDIIQFQSNDIILMLDSSWEFHSFHKKYLLSPKLHGSRIFSVLYDLVPLRTPAFCNQGMSIVFAKWLTDALQFSDGFICISKAVADEFHELLKAIKFPRPIKIGYWHLGANFVQNENPEPAAPTGKKTGPKKNYLMVGTLEPRKGHRVAISAFTSLWKKGHTGQLTIVGKKGWGVNSLIDEIENHPEYNKKLFWYDRVNDAQLAEIYAQSDILIAASFAEGFGLPIIEAANLNIPVIASDIPVFREVSAGHDVRFFDCGQWDSLSKLIEAYDQDDRKEMGVSQGLSPKILTWEESTQDLLKVIEGENWYVDYAPEGRPRFESNEIGDLGMSEFDLSITPKFDMEIVEKPFLSDNESFMKCIVKIVNQTDKCWSSIGPSGTIEKGVALGARYRDGTHLIDEGIRVQIPFTMVPEAPYYFSLDLPKQAILSGKQYVVELLQEGLNWWGNGIDIPSH